MFAFAERPILFLRLLYNHPGVVMRLAWARTVYWVIALLLIALGTVLIWLGTSMAVLFSANENGAVAGPLVLVLMPVSLLASIGIWYEWASNFRWFRRLRAPIHTCKTERRHAMEAVMFGRPWPS